MMMRVAQQDVEVCVIGEGRQWRYRLLEQGVRELTFVATWSSAVVEGEVSIVYVYRFRLIDLKKIIYFLLNQSLAETFRIFFCDTRALAVACGLQSTQAQQLWHMGLVAPRRVGCQFPHGVWDLSSLTRDQTCVPCTGRQIFNHWTTRKSSRLVRFFGAEICSTSFCFNSFYPQLNKKPSQQMRIGFGEGKKYWRFGEKM